VGTFKDSIYLRLLHRLLTEFGALPIPILRLALASLEKQGKAKVFEGSESGDSLAGVKFA
jgi:hypothetical protein